MIDLGTVFWVFLLWFGFGFQHSFLAQKWFKDKLRIPLGNDFVDFVYPFLYFLSQCLIFTWFWSLILTMPSGQVLMELPNNVKEFMVYFKVFGNYILLASVIAIDVNFFIGTKQILIYIRSKITKKPLPNIDDIAEARLSTRWIFIFVRHPMYVGIMIVYITHSFRITELYVVNFACLLIYTYIGIYFEERQLSIRYGADYDEYKKVTPKLNFVNGIVLALTRKLKS